MPQPCLAFALLCLLPFALPAGAQEVDCAAAEAQLDLTRCAEADWQEADAALNLAYGAARLAMRGIDTELPEAERGAEQALRDGQRAWVAFRDATCTAEAYAMHGGSAEPMLAYGCRARLTRARSADLQAMVEGF